VFVSTGSCNEVVVIDGTTLRVTGHVAVPGRPWGLGLTRDGRRLLTANGVASTVSVIDTATLEVVATVPAGKGAWGVAVGPG
jgi:YVTN family beta-propeller protein